MGTSSTECQSWSSRAACWAGGLGGGAFLLTAASSLLSLSLSRLCIGSACSVHGSSELNRQGVLTDPGVNCIFCLGCLGKEHQEGRTAPVPWASSAASLSPEMRKKSVSVVCTVQNPKCLTVLSGCLLGVVFFFFFLWERAE